MFAVKRKAIKRKLRFTLPALDLAGRSFRFFLFDSIRFIFLLQINREIKDPRIKIFAEFKHAKFNTHIDNSNHRKNDENEIGHFQKYHNTLCLSLFLQKLFSIYSWDL